MADLQVDTSTLLNVHPPVVRYDDHPGKQASVSLDDDIIFCGFDFLELCQVLERL